MKFIILLCLVFATVTIGMPDVSIGRFAHPEHPNKCVIDQLILEPGTVSKHPLMCSKITCHDNNKASIVTCPAMIPPTDCEVKEPMDPEANYPQCCRRKIVCKDGKVFNS